MNTYEKHAMNLFCLNHLYIDNLYNLFQTKIFL